MSPSPVFSVSRLIFHHLSLSIHISITLRPSLSNLLAAILPISVSFSLFRLFPPRSQRVAAAARPCQDQVALKS